MKSKVRRYFKEIIAAVIMSAIAGTGLANAEIIRVDGWKYLIHGRQTLNEFFGPSKTIDGLKMRDKPGSIGVEPSEVPNFKKTIENDSWRFFHKEYYDAELAQKHTDFTSFITLDEFISRSIDIDKPSKHVFRINDWRGEGSPRLVSVLDAYKDELVWKHLGEPLDNDIYFIYIYEPGGSYSGYEILLYSGYDKEKDTFTKFNSFVFKTLGNGTADHKYYDEKGLLGESER